jgi:hypothetical protein
MFIPFLSSSHQKVRLDDVAYSLCRRSEHQFLLGFDKRLGTLDIRKPNQLLDELYFDTPGRLTKVWMKNDRWRAVAGRFVHFGCAEAASREESTLRTLFSHEGHQ